MIKKIIILSAILVLPLSMALMANNKTFAQGGDDPYVTQYTSYYYRTVPCSWVKWFDVYYCSSRYGVCCHNPDGTYCKAKCGDCGGVSASIYRSSCNGSTWCDNVAWYSPGTRQVRVSTTGYKCNYISGVSSWGSCVNHLQSAQDVTWSEKIVSSPTSQCEHEVELTRYCNNPPVADITAPANGSTYDQNDEVNFTGTATDADGDTIVGYQWRNGSCSSGQVLSTNDSFSQGGFDPGTSQTIYLRAQDDQGDWSNCDQVTINIRPSCIPNQVPAENVFCPGDNENLTSNTAITRVDSPSECTSGQKCEYYPYIVGSCGEASNNEYCSKPTKSLCSKGNASSVEIDGDYWKWTCQGINASNEECQALQSCAWKEVSPE